MHKRTGNASPHPAVRVAKHARRGATEEVGHHTRQDEGNGCHMRVYQHEHAKAQDAAMARIVVELKSELEKIREQIQNIE